MSKSSFVAKFLLVGFFASLIAIFPQGAVLAAGNAAHQAKSPATPLLPLTDACYSNAGNNSNPAYAKSVCDGHDPHTSGCDVGATTLTAYGGKLAIYNLYAGTSFFVGYVELRYSPHCATNWTRIRPCTQVDPNCDATAATAYQIKAGIARQGDSDPVNQGTYNYGLYTLSNVGLWWTPMVFAPTTPAMACGLIILDGNHDGSPMTQCTPWI